MKRIITTFKLKWPEYFLEVLVIIIGVLGAFGLNNWNEQRKLDHQHKEIISNLHEEFLNNLTSLNSQIDRLNRKIEACEKLNEWFGSDLSQTEGSIIDSVIVRTIDSPTWNPSSYVLTEMKNSGQIKILKNQDLKRMLFEWDQHFENLKEWYQLEVNFYEKYMDYLVSNGSFRNLRLNTTLGAESKSKFEGQNKELLQDVVFENLNTRNLGIASSIVNRYNRETVNRMNEIISETK